MGKQLLGASRSVPGAGVRGDLYRLEEAGREEEGKKLMYGKRLEGLEDNRLVKIASSRKAEGCCDGRESMGRCRENM